MIRRGTPDDFGAATELLNLVWPERVGSERGLHHAYSAEPEAAQRRYWAAVENGRLVGWADASVEYQSASRPGSLAVSVALEWRGRGLGSALFAAAEKHLRALGTALVLGDSTDEEAERRFALARGFRHTRTIRISAVDPRNVKALQPSPGVELARLVDLDPVAVHAIDAEAMGDIPGDAAMDDVGLEQWLDDYWRHPDMDLESSTAVLVDGRPVSFSMLRVAPDGLAVTDMTGTLRAHRGRGYAFLAKQATLARAATRGVPRVITDNHETNAAMLRVNEKLGYEPAGALLSWARP